jgi:hypothetical protein
MADSSETPATVEQIAGQLYQAIVKHSLHGRHGEARAQIAREIKAAKLATIAEVERLGAPNAECSQFLREMRAKVEAGQ